MTCIFLPSICLPLFSVVHTARTETLLPTLPRSPGCSTLLWRKTSPSVVHSTNSGENPTAHSYSSPQRCFVFTLRAFLTCSWVFFRYKAVIDACSLQPDIDLLPFGDQTEIGERVCKFLICLKKQQHNHMKGFNLSVSVSGHQPEWWAEAENLCGQSFVPKHQHRLLGKLKIPLNFLFNVQNIGNSSEFCLFFFFTMCNLNFF